MSDTTKGAAATVERLRKAAAALAEHEAKRGRLVATRDRAMAACRAAGVKPGIIAEVAGVSPGRVSQVAPDPERTKAQAPGRAVPMTMAPTVPEGPIMSGRATRRHEASYAPRVAAWVELHTGRGVTAFGTDFVLGGHTLADTLAGLPRNVARVFVTGDWAGVPHLGGSIVGDVRAWGTAEVPGWVQRGHWTATDEPVFRYTEEATGRDVEVLSARGWFGDEAGPRECADAWAEVAAIVAARFPGAVLLATPASTGRDLWQRTIGERVSYPTLSQPIRDLIITTSGQGRTELLPGRGDVDGFTYMDGRFMYAALMYGLPVGEATHLVVGETWPEWARGDAALNKRGRWLAKVTVPEGWAHVGLLGRQTAAGWDYPATPGETWEGWHDAAEIRLARQHGWHIGVREGIVWQREGKPLTAWRDTLVQAWDESTDPLVRGALRALVLFGLGGFASRTPTAEGWADREEDVPAGAQVHREGGRFRYVYRVQANAWQESMAHPEWPATVWARARVALLDHALPGGGRGGALHVPVSEVMGFRTDAIYLAGDAPDWADDGRPGRFRVKGSIDGPVEWPASPADLLALRERSEGEQ